MRRYASAAALALMIILGSRVYAEAPYNGWMQIQTDYLLIIFEPQDLSYARQIAEFGDDAYLKLAELLNHFPSKRIPVVLAGRTAAANGFYSPMPHSVTVFITSPPSRFLGSRTEHWLENLLIHELAHYIHLTSPVGPARVLAPIFGPDAAAMNTIFMPGWWLEGITTWAESALAPGGRGDAPFFTLTYKAPVLEETMWSLQQSAYQSAYPPRGRIYVAGYLFTSYLMERFGHDVYYRINARFAAFPFFGIGPAVRRETGYDAQELYADMVRMLSDRFAEDADMPAAGMPFSPRKTGDYHIPVMTDTGPVGIIRTLELGSAAVRYREDGSVEVIRNLSVTDPQSFNPSACGRFAVYASYQAPVSHSASIALAEVSWADVHLMELDTGTVTRITEGKRLFHPVLSPDGSSIAAIERMGTRYRLVHVDPVTGDVSVLYDPPGASVYEPRFSPDGSVLAAVEVKAGESALIIADRNNQVSHIIPHADGGIYRPRFTRDGHLLFGSDRDGSLALYRFNPETGELFLVLEDPVGVFGAEPVREGFIFGTYRSSGHTLRYSEADLAGIPADLSDASGIPERELEPPKQYAAKPYRDFPRPGLWLPLPDVDADGNLSPGAWGIMRSILGRHAVSASAAWNIPHAQPIGIAEYLFNPGWGSLSVYGSSRFHADPNGAPYREHIFSIALSLPVLQRSYAYGRDLAQVSSRLQLGSYPYGYAAITAQASYGYLRYAAPAEFFGSHGFSILGGSHFIFPAPSEPWGAEPYMQASMQASMPGRLPLVRLELGLRTSTFSDVSTALPPRGSPPWIPEADARAKAQGSLLVRLPLGLFDQPIPFGGLTGAGLTAFIQSALYGDSGSIFWQKELYGGAELTTELSLGGLASLRPSVGITADLMTGSLHPYFDLHISTWIGSRAEVDQFTLRR